MMTPTRPEAIVLIGIQGAGKSTFYRQRFFDTHVRLSRDLLRTRAREQGFLEACFRTGQRFVVDNTNVHRGDRARWIVPARAAGFTVVGYFFPPGLRAALARNAQREGTARIPVPGVIGTYKRLEAPTLDEGFDALFAVRTAPAETFTVEPWPAAEGT